MVSDKIAHPATCRPEDVLFNLRKNQMQFLFSDVQIRGEYPGYAARYFEDENIKLRMEPGDEELLKQYPMVLTISSAYALTRKELKGRKVMSFLIMFTMYFTAGTIPDYLLMNDLKMLDTWWCMILPLSFSAYNFLIMMNNFQSSIPESLIESAVIDGAGHFKILTKIVIPLSKPIIATIALFYAVGRWNAYSDALFYIKQRVNLRPLQLKLYYLVVAATESFKAEGVVATGQITNPEVLKASCIIFATLPIVCIYPFVQKYFVRGTMIGAVKG